MSPEGDAFVSCGESGLLCVWSLSTRKQLGVPLNPTWNTGSIHDVVLGPHGKVIAATQKGILLWKDVHERVFSVLKGDEDDDMQSVALSSDGRKLVAGSRKGWVIVWDLETEETLHRVKGHQWPVHHVAFSFDGKHIASGSEDSRIQIWEAVTMTAVGLDKPIRGPVSAVRAVAFSPTSNNLLAVHEDDTIRLWSVEPKKVDLKWHSKQSFLPTSVAFSPDGKSVVWGSEDDNCVRLLDVSTGSTIGTPLLGHTHGITSVAFISDTTALSGSEDGTIRMWDASCLVSEDSKDPADQGTTGIITAVAFSKDGRQMATASEAGIICLWDSRTGMVLAQNKPLGPEDVPVRREAKALAFSPDGILLCLGDKKGIVSFLRTSDLKIDGVPSNLHTGQIRSISFSVDGSTLLSASDDNTACLLDVKTRKRLGLPFSGHQIWVMSASFSPSGDHVVSTSVDRKLRIWNIKSRKQLGPALTLRSDAFHNHAILWFKGDSFIMDGRSWNVRSAVGTKEIVPKTVPFDSLPMDSAVPLWVDESGWIKFGDESLFWLPMSFGRNTTCYWHRGSGIVAISPADGGLILLDASKPVF